MTELQRLDHAALVHALEAYECDTCADRRDPGCSLCGGHGTYYRLDLTPCGRADCPIGRRPA